MKFTFDRNSLISEISIAQEIISSKSTASVLSNVLFVAEGGTLTIKATDTRVNFQTKIPVEVEEGGSTTVFCDKLMGILTALPEGEIEFSLQQRDNQTTAVIRHSLKKIKFQLKCMSQSKFPDFDALEKVVFFDVPAKEFKVMVVQTAFAVSTDETRYFMNGVYFEKKGGDFVLVSTDGRRLAYIAKPILADAPEFPPAIVHPKILNIIAKHAGDEGNISVAVVDKVIFFKFANYELSAQLIDGQFPNYQRVIPENQPYVFKVDKAEFLDALRRISIMLDKKVGRVFLNVAPGVLRLYSQESEIGDANEEIPCEFAGDEITIAMNCRHIEEPLKVMGAGRIAFEFQEALRAVTLRPEPAEDYFHILMPMQME